MTSRRIIPQSVRAWYAGNQARTATPGLVPGVPVDLAHSVDPYGSLVTVEPADWLICFVPGLKKQWWHRFVHATHKHVYAMRATETGSWVLVEPWWTRFMITVLPSPDAVKFLRWGATGDILRVREAVPGNANQARGWSNCAVLTAFVLGRSSRSWTPHGLYLELLKEKGVKHENVEDLLVAQFTRIVGSAASDAMRLRTELMAAPLHEVLTHLGRNLLSVFMSPSLLQLCHTAIIEAERYPRVTAVYNEHGLQPAIETLARLLEAAKAKGEIAIADSHVAAGQFIAMLRGNVHFEAVLELRPPPSAAEIDDRVRSAVKIFLRGVEPVPA